MSSNPLKSSISGLIQWYASDIDTAPAAIKSNHIGEGESCIYAPGGFNIMSQLL